MNEKKSAAWSYQDHANNMLKGCVVGGAVTAVVSPFLSWTNLTIDAKNKAIEAAVKANKNVSNIPRVKIMPLLFNGRVFLGTSSYVSSVAPNTAVNLALNDFLKRALPNTKLAEGMAAFGSGFIAGLINTPFEAIAQESTLIAGIPKTAILKQIIAVNGKQALMRGALSLGLREGSWSFAYVFAPQALGEFFQTQNMGEDNARRLAAVISGSAFGFLSCTINQFRYQMQSNLTIKGPSKGYIEHGKDLWLRAPNASPLKKLSFFFNGGVPRTIASATAALLISDGLKYYDMHVKTKP